VPISLRWLPPARRNWKMPADMTDHQILTAEAHGTLRIRPNAAPELGDAVMCCLTVPAEFREVQAHYPILFRQNAERTAFTALAMFGFTDEENLFLGPDGWETRYRPLAIAIQPFLIGRTADDAATKQVHIDMASPRIGGEEGVRLFDDTGRPTPYLDDIAEKLGALDEGYQACGGFFDALRRHDLLEPLTLGFHVIDEQRLRGLDGAALGDLHREGHLMPIFMAVASLAHLGDLVARKNRRDDG
jgi:hypothetical protein